MSAWQPIATAPRDGTMIVVAVHFDPWGWVLGTGRWVDFRGINGWMTRGFADPPGNLGLAHPTHWQPLPPPPESPR